MWKPLALLTLAACSVPTADAKDGTSEWGESRNHTPYSCAGVVADDQVPTVDPAVIAPWHELAKATKHDQQWASEVELLTYRWDAKRPTVEGRVRIQHEMLAVASKLDTMRRSEREPTRVWYAAIHKRVMALVQAMAPTAAQLDELGAGNRPALHGILGPALGIVERSTEFCGTGNLRHVRMNGGLLAFRPLRADDRRALVSQLVAFDDHGQPHITPLVAGAELRLGHETSSPACIVQAELDGRLKVQTHQSFEEHAPFVRRRDDGVGCKSCHYNANAMNARDLTAAETSTVDVARTGQVDRLATNLWKSLTEPYWRTHMQ